MVLGSEGSGKTAALREVRSVLVDQGWGSVFVNGSERGWVDDLVGKAGGVVPLRNLRSGFSPGLRYVLSYVSDRLGASGKGLVVLVDDLHAAERDDYVLLVNVVQHVTRREGRPMLFVGSGLEPDVYDTVLSGRDAGFFLRCARFQLGPLTVEETVEALREPFREVGVVLPEGLVVRLAELCGGDRLRTQQVGARLWELLSDGEDLSSELVPELVV